MPSLPRITRSLPSHYSSRAEAFRSVYTKGEFTLDLFTVDRLLQQNDHELCVEVVCLMLDYLNNSDRNDTEYPAGCAASYQAIINRLGVNKGAVGIDHEYLVPLLALLPDGLGTTPTSAGGAPTPCRKELADMVYVLRQRNDWTSETFGEAMQGTQWQSTYTDLSELYAINYSSDIRIENLHYGKLFEMLFYRPETVPRAVTAVTDTDKDDEKTGDDVDDEKTDDGADEEETENDTKKKKNKKGGKGEEEEEDEDHETSPEDEDAEADEDDEVDIIDPLNEDITQYNQKESLNSFLMWIGFHNSETPTELILSNHAAQIAQFLGMSYYHAVCAVLGVAMSFVHKQQKHLNFRVVYMLHQWFFANEFPVPQIILDFEAPLLTDINETRASQVYFLSYEKRLRELGQLDPNQPEHDIGVTKRATHLPFWSETRLMFITAMMDASVYNGGTHLNAPYGYTQWLDSVKQEQAQVKEDLDNAEENGTDEVDEFQEKHDELSTQVEVSERYFSLLDRFHEVMYNNFNTKFSSYTCVLVAWIIAKAEGDTASLDILEKFFGIGMENWKEYDAEQYYAALLDKGANSLEECGLDFAWGTEKFCAELEQARVINYNLTKPCSDYDDLLYRVLAQLTMIDHIDGIDWVMENSEKKTGLQDITNTVIYGRLPLFAFANQLNECSMETTKALVKRKAKVVVNSQYSESCNIFLATFCNNNLSDDQVLEIFEYWHGFCKRNPKSNQMHINLYELYSMLNRAWSLRYSRATRTQSLQFLAANIIPASTIEQLVSSPEPNFLQALFTSFTAQSTYCDEAPSGNTASRFGDFACISYEQELLGLIYTIVFPTPNHMGKALQVAQPATTLLTPIFLHQSKKAFDHILFTLKFPVRLEIVALMLNAMLPCMDWSSCVDVQSIVLQYQQYVFQQQNKPKKKAKKAAKKGGKGGKKNAAAAPPTPTVEESAADVPVKLPPSDTFTMDLSGGDEVSTSDTEFVSYVNSTMLSSLKQLQMNATAQFNILVTPELNTDPKKQQEYIQNFNKSIKDTYGEEVLTPGKYYPQDIESLQQAIASRDENTHSVSFFNKEDPIQIDNAAFNAFNSQVIVPYKSSLLAQHINNDDDTLSKSDLNDLSDNFNSLFNTVLITHSKIGLNDKYSNLTLDTTVLDALIWFVDKNEKLVAEDYGVEIGYGFILYSLAALLTLFNQVATSTLSENTEDDESPAHQVSKLYLALATTMATAQGSPIAQIFQLLLGQNNPLPVAYQQCMNRVQNDQLRHFYSPWVQGLYFRSGNIRTMAKLALDLECQVQQSPSGQKLFIHEDDKINAKLTWNTQGLEVEYTPTNLYQIILTGIITESLAQSYILAFQQHYPQRVQYTKSLMQAQQIRQQQSSPFWTHTNKFHGLAGLVAVTDMFKQLSFIPQQISFILFGLMPGLAVCTTIATSPDLTNIHSVWKFYALKRLAQNPTNPQLSFLSSGTHQSWMIDIMDLILSRSDVSQNNIKLLETAVKLPSDITTTPPSVTAFNPFLNSLINYAQLSTPLSQVNEILTMDYWAQITHTFGSLVNRAAEFFLLNTEAQSERDDKSILGDFDPKTNFTMMAADPIFINGLVDLYNKYIAKENGQPLVTVEEFSTALQSQLKSLTTSIADQDDQVESVLSLISDELLLKWNIDNAINGIEQEKPKPKPVEIKPISMPISKMMPSTMSSIANPKKPAAAAATTASPTTEDTDKTDTEVKPETKAAEPSKAEPSKTSIVTSPDPEPTQIHSFEQTPSTEQPGSGFGTVITLGAVAGLVGAAIYAGLTYFQATKASSKPSEPEDHYHSEKIEE